MEPLMSCLLSGHRVNFCHLVGVSGATKPLKGYYLQLRILSLALEEELKVLDLFKWLNYYYFLLLGYFPLLLYFHPTPIL